jgi:hypothetical protein
MHGHADIEVITPVSATLTTRKWKPPRIRTDTVSVGGGFGGKTFVVQTLQIATSPSKEDTFVECCKNSDWFRHAVGGEGVGKGECRFVDVLEILRKKVNEQFSGTAVAGEDDAPLASLESDSPVADMIDPMDQLDDGAAAATARPLKRARRKANFHKVVTLPMPLHPPCAVADCHDTKDVMCYYGGKTCKKTFVRITDIPWLLAYAADEHHFQGVAAIQEPTMRDSRRCNVPEIPDLHISWDFHKRMWLAEFIEGPFLSLKKTFSMAQLLHDRWSLMQDTGFLPADIDLVAATPKQKKDAAKKFILMWCDAIVHASGQEFEELWGLAVSH